MPGEVTPNRVIFQITGADRETLLHGLVTNDVKPAGEGLSYSALLTPQGKFLADFFLLNRGDDILLDVADAFAPALAQRLAMYKLRADVTIEASDVQVCRGLGEAPEGAWPDPRHPALGWRGYGIGSGAAPEIDWQAIRVTHCIPESGVELIAGEGFILEAGFERLSGVDHRKGCYVGQEVTARMKHKTELRKGLVTVDIAGAAEPGSDILAEGKAAGTLFSQAGGKAIAHLRFDRATGPMMAGDATITWDGQQPG